MLHWILVDIIQSGKIRVPVCEPCLPKIVPDLALRGIIESIDPLRSLLVQKAKHLREIVGSFIRRVANEVIMIRKDGPGFEMPAKIVCDRKQAPLKHSQSLAILKVMGLPVSSRGYHIGAAGGQFMKWRVRPCDLLRGSHIQSAVAVPINRDSAGALQSKCVFPLLRSASPSTAGRGNHFTRLRSVLHQSTG